jgi:hypothetical protein
MANYVIYSIPLIRSASGQMPVEEVKQGGRFLFVVSGDLAGATIDLRVKYEGHPEEIVMLGLGAPDKNVSEVWLPVGTEVSTSIMGGTPQSVNATLILVE